MALLFISIHSHRETIAAKDETISILRETVQNLTQSLKALEAAAEAMKPRPGITRSTERARKPVDYASLDPNDNVALLDAARHELGPGKTTMQHLQQRAEHIRRLIVMSKAAQTERAQQPGPPPPPDAIAAQIEAAIQQGVEAAQKGQVN